MAQESKRDYARLTYTRAFALKLIARNDIHCPRQFAELMWPSSDGWHRIHNVGHGVHRGGAMPLAAGGYLGKLRRDGLIVGGYDRPIMLTEKGHDLLRGLP